MNIVIFAIPGIGNLGDDLISVLLVDKIVRSYPKSQVTVVSYPCKSKIDYIESKNVQLYKAKNFFEITFNYSTSSTLKKIMAGADFILLGGGGLIQDTHSNYNVHSLLQYTLHSSANRAVIGMVGVGFGPIKNIYNQNYIDVISSRFSFIQIRDQYSKKYLKNFQNELIVSPDIVSGTKNFPKYTFLKKSTHQSKILGCSIRPWPELKLDSIVNLIQQTCNFYDLDCTLFVFEYGPWNNTEYVYAQKLKKNLNDKGIKSNIITYNLDSWYDFSSSFSSVSRAIACRFHANILWQKLGIPVLPISYAPKVKSLYEEKGGTVLNISFKEKISNVKLQKLFQLIDLDEEYFLPDLKKYSRIEPTDEQKKLVKQFSIFQKSQFMIYGIKKIPNKFLKTIKVKWSSKVQYGNN